MFWVKKNKALQWARLQGVQTGRIHKVIRCKKPSTGPHDTRLKDIDGYTVQVTRAVHPSRQRFFDQIAI